jgi:hypothetical protein
MANRKRVRYLRIEEGHRGEETDLHRSINTRSILILAAHMNTARNK